MGLSTIALREVQLVHELVLELRHGGEFEKLRGFGELSAGSPVLEVHQGSLRALTGGIADGDDALSEFRRDQTNGAGAVGVDVIAEGPGNVDLFNVMLIGFAMFLI